MSGELMTTPLQELGTPAPPEARMKYDENPGCDPTFQATGDYYDVHVDDDTNVTSTTIDFCPATEEIVIYFWNGSSWEARSAQSYSGGCIIVTITESTFLSLSDLTGLAF